VFCLILCVVSHRITAYIPPATCHAEDPIVFRTLESPAVAGYKLKQTEIMSQHMMRRTPLCSDDGQSEINQVSAPQYVPTCIAADEVATNHIRLCFIQESVERASKRRRISVPLMPGGVLSLFRPAASTRKYCRGYMV